MADVVAGCKRVEVADHLIRCPHVGADHCDEVAINLASFGELHNRDLDAFLIDRFAIGAKAAPADIDDVRGAGEEADELTGDARSPSRDRW